MNSKNSQRCWHHDNKKFFNCWKYIEKIAFSPVGSKDIEGWLNCFMKFFYTIYEQETYFPNIFDKEKKKFSKEFTFSPIDTTFKFVINPDISAFSFQLNWERNNPDYPNLLYEYDSEYHCEWDYINESNTFQKKLDFNEEDLECILHHMIFHPAIHCHIFSELWTKNISAASHHDIRIGMLTKNPFLFLYQVSFQFLSIIEERKKQAELKRLAKVIWENRNNRPISPGLLFSLSTNRSKPDQKKVQES